MLRETKTHLDVYKDEVVEQTGLATTSVNELKEPFSKH